MAPWCSGYHCCSTSFSKAWTQVLRRFKSCSRSVGVSRWWGSLTVVPAGNKATPFVGQPYHKKINHHHNHHMCWNNFIKKKPKQRCFPKNIVKRTTFFRTPSVAVSGYLKYFQILLWFNYTSSHFYFYYVNQKNIEWHVFFSFCVDIKKITNIQKKKCNSNKKNTYF